MMPLLEDTLKWIYGPKRGLLQGRQDFAEREMGLLNAARGGDKEASSQWMRGAMQSPFMGLGVGNIKAYHGTPHAFTKFSNKHIGKGEGAQSYGHGLYFAENPKVALQYQRDLTAMRVSAAKRQLAQSGGSIDDALAEARAKIDRLRRLPNAGNNPKRQAAQIAINEEKIAELTALKSTGQMSKGRVYEVNLKPEPDDFLDWDKPLSQQSQATKDAIVRLTQSDTPLTGEYAKRIRLMLDNKGTLDSANSVMGEDLITLLGSDKVGADVLRKAGVKGIKYKDAGSRGSNEGTNNFVVFDDADVEILRGK